MKGRAHERESVRWNLSAWVARRMREKLDTSDKLVTLWFHT